jgi:hypothetical protein
MRGNVDAGATGQAPNDPQLPITGLASLQIATEVQAGNHQNDRVVLTRCCGAPFQED